MASDGSKMRTGGTSGKRKYVTLMIPHLFEIIIHVKVLTAKS
jgi:hypothetical protein